ncbi:MAG TPA: sarcosine oxidase subunit gamma [Rhodobacteraceae bacterium]|nr:sarcosine oxidase subunit gamma [Paracoccaceae bacterium]
MSELIAKSPCAGLLPAEAGGLRLSEAELGALTTLAPFRGAEKAATRALKAAHGLAWPEPGQATGEANKRAIWFGRAHVLLAGPAPDASLARHAALTDQSDGWAAVRLEGAGLEHALARLVPIDTRPAALSPGRTARTQLGHMTVSLTRLEEHAVLILAFRSMAATLVHELKTAMEAVAARG